MHRLDALARDWILARRYTEPSRKSAKYALMRFLNAESTTAWWQSISHLSAGSLRNNYAVAHGYCEYLVQLGELDRNPVAGIVPPKSPRPNPVTLSAADVDAIRAACSNPRDRAIVELMWGIGLRCVEVSRLEVGDVDLAGRFVTVTGKGGGVDILPLPERAAAAIEVYLDAHPASAGPLFRDLRWHRKPVTAQWMSEVVGKIITDSGVKRRAFDGRGAHALRRTCATDLLDNGATIRDVQAVLRHTSLSSTEHYLRRSKAEDLRSLLEARSSPPDAAVVPLVGQTDRVPPTRLPHQGKRLNGTA